MSDEKKKKKKAFLLKKNRELSELYNIFRLRSQETERAKKAEDARKPKPAEKKPDEVVWSEKVSTIRNRLDGKKRVSRERWNRFAGTESAGARGL